MPKVRELDRLDQLKRSGFGQPPPRHGLHLLYWFATECISFDANGTMIWLCNPTTEDFGFHRYWNLPDNNGAKLLPDTFKPYHTVGNLNFPNADRLPKYVRRQNSSYWDGSNKDRLIISVEHDKVYVTVHLDRTNFDPRATYQISHDLLRTIRCMKGREFVKAMIDKPYKVDTTPYNTPNAQEVSPRSRRCLDCCTIL